MADPTQEMPEDSLRELVADVRNVLGVTERDAVAIVRASSSLWGALEKAGGLVDSFGGSEFCALFPQMLAALDTRQQGAEEPTPKRPMSFSAIYNTLPMTTTASTAIHELAAEVDQAATEVQTPLRLGIHFVVTSPRYGSPGFEGISKKREFHGGDTLFVSAAISDPTIGREQVVELIAQAVDVAVKFARRKKIADDLPVLRSLLATLRANTVV